MSEIKLCVNCEHGIFPDKEKTINPECRISEEKDPVYGNSSFRWCVTERSQIGKCGPYGGLWKPKCS